MRASNRRGAAAPMVDGVLLGRRLLGDAVLDSRASEVVLGFQQLARHVLVAGSSGSGKTETALRIAHEVAAKTDAAVFMVDPKGDLATARRFVGLMEAAGRSPRVFPNEPFDAWRGDGNALVNRLLEVVPFATTGSASYFRDIAKVALQLVCGFEEGPPRSSEELLDRLQHERLSLEYSVHESALQALTSDQVDQVRMRYTAFFGQLGRRLDGEWSWDDADAGYLLLDSVALREDAVSAACLLLEDFAHYFSQRKAEGREVLLVLDEYPAIARATDLDGKVTQARSFDAWLVLLAQTLSGLGEQHQRDAIVGNTATVIAHAMPEPQGLAALAGTRPSVELTRQFDEAGIGAKGTSREAERPKVSESDVRELSPGEAWVISAGKAAKVAVQRAPETAPGELPEQQEWRRERKAVAKEPRRDLDDLYGEA